jgi:RHS repeat-associated protein
MFGKPWGQRVYPKAASSNKRRDRPRSKVVSYRPFLEAFEDRVLLSTVTWVGGSGDWSVGSNWSNGVGPGAGDDAVINVAGITVTHSTGSDTVKSLTANDAIGLSGGTLTVTGSLQVQNGNTFSLSGGTLASATVTTSGGGQLIATSSGCTLNGVTLGGTVNGNPEPGAMTVPGGVSVTGGLTLANNSVIQVGDASHSGFIQFSGNETVSGTGAIAFAGDGGSFNIFDNLTLGPGITVHGTNANLFNVTGSLTNQGTIISDSGGTISISGNGGTSWTNAAGGTLSANGGTLGFGNSWSNAGQILVEPNSALNLGGSFTTAGLGSYTNNGGTINLTGSLNNTGATLALNATTGPWILAGGTINGGTVATAAKTALISSLGGGTLQGVTLGGTVNASAEPGTLTAASGGITVTGGLTLANNTVIQVGDASHGGSIQLSSNQTVGGTGAIAFVGDGGSLNIFDNLTLGPGITVHGTNANLFNVTGSLAIEGTIEPDTGGTLSFGGNGGTSWTNAVGATLSANGGTLSLGGSWSNAGQIIVPQNSTLNLGGSFTTAGLGSYTNNGGTINLTGSLNNTGATLALNATTGPWILAGGTINGGTVATAANTALIPSLGGGTLQGVTLGGTVNGNAEPGTLTAATGGITVTGGLTLANNTAVQVGEPSESHSGDIEFNGSQTVGGTGQFQFVGLGGQFRILSGTLTLGPGITVHGLNTPLNQLGQRTNFVNIILIGGNLANQGTFQMDGGNNLIISGNSGTLWNNSGTFAVTNALVSLGDAFTLSPTSSFHNSGSIVVVAGTLNNTGATLTLNANTGTWLVGGADQGSGDITGGTVATTGGEELLLIHGTLDGVTMAGTLDLTTAPFDTVSVVDGLTLQNGTILVGHGESLAFAGTQTLGGTGTVDFTDSTSANSLTVPNASTTLTIGPGVTVHGNTGTINAGSAAFLNQGTIAADGDGTLTAEGAANFNNGTLSGGTWQASAGSTLRLIGANITTDAADLVLDGAGSQIFSDTGTTNALASLASVTAGARFTVQNGAGLSTTASAFTNAGTVVIGNASTLTMPGAYTQSAGTTTVNGTLAPGGTVAVNGGVLSGAGTVRGSVVNAGQVTPGNAPGILTITGNYTQTASGALNVEVGGTTPGSGYDQLNISGTATLGGTLNISLINGFGPAFGQTFQVMSFAGSTGNFASINGLQQGRFTVFNTSLNSTNLVLNAIINAADLAFSSMTLPASGTPGQTVSIPYTVNNLSTTPAIGDWFDSFYLSRETVLDPAATLLGRVHHVGDVAGNSTYSETLTATLPGLPDGNYHVIAVIDSRGLVPDFNRANNTAFSSTVINVSVPQLSLGVSTSGTIANGQDEYFHLVLAPGANVTLTANFTASPEAEFYVRYAALPDRSNFDQTAASVTDQHPQITLNNVQGGDYFILLHGREGAGSGTSFTLQANGATFAISSFSPNDGSNQGQATISIVGSEFTPQTTVSLVDTNNISHPANSLLLQDSQHLAATFDLTQLALGGYTLEARDSGRLATASSVFNVIVGVPGHLSLLISTPAAIRVGEPIQMNITAINGGDTDVPISVLQVNATDVATSQATEQFLGEATNTLPGFLPPHFDGSVGGFTYDPEPHGAGTTSTFSLVGNPSSTVIDWDGQKESLRPSSVPEDAWNAIFANLRPVLGNTVADLETLLRNDALALAQNGVFTNDLGQLLSFEMLKADDEVPAPVLAQATDLAFPAPGLPLVFTRSFQGSVAGRYALTRLGRGWVDNFAITATTVNPGGVVIQEGPVTRFFAQLPDGAYVSSPGDFGALTQVNGALQLREKNGELIAFRTDGSLDYIQDTNQNRITAGYTDSLLTSLTQSDGSVLTLSYNAQGLLSQVSDPTGRTVTYTYDASGQLASCTTPAGTTAYTYTSDITGPRAYSLTTITNPGDTHQFFNYDSQGRLAQQERDGAAEALNYTYDIARFRVTDGKAGVTTYFFDNLGRLDAHQDPLGNVTRYGYDGATNLVSITPAGSGPASLGYDRQGNPISAVDPLGNQQAFSYEPTFNNLVNWIDAQGNATAYAHDANGNLAGTSYPDGSTEQDSYDAQGNLVRSVNRRGQVINYTYDNRGLLLEQQFPDGSHFDYSYDSHGNMISATDANGTTSMQYDSANRMTKIAYPNGRFLQFTFDAGGRRTQTVDQDGFTVNYSYDVAGRLAQLTDANDNLIVKYTYDSVGRLVRKDQGNGTYTTYAFDAAGQLLHLTNFAPNNSINSRFDYVYDVQGRRTSMTTLDGTTTYGYDADNRLASVTLPSGRIITYQYDAAGNRTAVKDNGVTTNYTANNLNEYTNIGGGADTYDPSGDLIGTSGSLGNTSYAYDALGRIIAVTTPTDTWTFQHDALGNRIASVHNGQQTEYLVDPTGIGTVLGEYDGSGHLLAHYTYGLGLTSQVPAGSSANYYDFDAVGSTAGLSGPSGSYVNRYSYLPFGETIAASEAVANPFRYNGQVGVQDDGNGLNFMRSRYYAPSQGRFIQPDPIGLTGGANMYAYAGNNPVSLTDPIGLRPAYIGDSGGADPNPDVNGDNGAYAGVPLWDGAPVYGPGFGRGFQAADAAAEVGTAAARQEAAAAAEAAAAVARSEALAAAYAGWPESIVGGAFTTTFVMPVLGTIGGASILIDLWWIPQYFGAQLGKKFTGHLPPCSPFLPGLFSPFCSDARLPSGLLLGETETEQIGGLDPNFLAGPAGFGATEFIRPDQGLPYRIDFSNEANATGPAQQVVVTQHLDPNLDPSTFQLDSFGFGGQTFQVPAGRQFYSTRIDERSTFGIFVDFTASFDPTGDTVTWTLTSIDPKTLDIPADPRVGFLPPDVNAPQGEGFVSYSVQPKSTDPTGTVIKAQASVVFDVNAAIATNTFTNTIDAGPPTSTVLPLPASTHSPQFLVQWTGQDDPGGSGIASFDIFVSDNGGPFTLWLQQTPLTQAIFEGQTGHTYGFYSVAQDNVGHVQATPSAAEAQKAVGTIAATHFQVTPSVTVGVAGTSFTVTVTALDPFNHVVLSFTGKVHFTSSDKQAVLPKDYTFVSGDQGVHTFTVTLKTAGNQTVSVSSSFSGLSTEFAVPTAGSNPFGITTGPDGNLWFAETAGNQIGRVTPSGVVTEFALPATGSQPLAITAGPDGNLWFTEEGGNRIGRISPAGALTEFALPMGGSQPFGIIKSPDNNLWFTELGGNRIGRITPTGTLTEFALAAGSAPEGIVAGSDGNLWFTESGSSKIGRISTAGAVTEFALAAGRAPEGIAVGPDKNLWFTEFAGNRIGRITTAGVVTEFAVPTAGSQPVAIVTGPDNNLWFTESSASQLGRITTKGVLSEFPTFTGFSQPAGITTGPDKNLWFTEAAADGIARFTPASTVAGQAVATTEFVTSTGGSQPESIAAGPDGNLWFVETAANQIGRITPSGTVTEFPIPTVGSQPAFITKGPDGNLWFTEEAGNQIGRITPGGTITEFPVPAAASSPLGVTTGPDGNLWFTEFAGNRIGRITPAGVVTEFALAAGSAPEGITAGPDGNLWFTESGTNKIGRITRTGTLTEFPLAPGSAPDGITTGPDKNLWFTEFGGNRIGRITRAGTITEFAIPTAGSRPVGIVTGPDKNLWFTECAANQLGQITPKGVIAQFAVPTAASQPTGIATGPDGNLWFTETQAGQIGRLTPAIQVSPAAASVLVVSGFPSPTDTGAAHNFTVTAKDAFGNVATGYTGTVQFSSTDPAAALPAKYTFTAADHGKHTFSATLNTVGTWSLTAQDTVNAVLTSSQTGIQVEQVGFRNPSVTTPLLEGQEAILTGTITDSNPQDTYYLTVNWGDGTAAQTFVFGPGSARQVRLTHRYLAARPVAGYLIRLEWHNQQWVGRHATLRAVVSDPVPVVHAGGPVTLAQGQVLDRRGFFADLSPDSWTATVDYGDGSGRQVLTLDSHHRFRLYHKYVKAGTFRVVVAVTDEDGVRGRGTFSVTVTA